MLDWMRSNAPVDSETFRGLSLNDTHLAPNLLDVGQAEGLLSLRTITETVMQTWGLVALTGESGQIAQGHRLDFCIASIHDELSTE
jgi:hypothetical protein